MFGLSLLEQPLYFILWAIAIIVAFTIHEFAHALAARVQGDRTAEDAGRLTLNPLAHIDWMGFLLLLLIGFGWAKPTPFNPYNLTYKRFGSALVALAGPISNILVATLLVVVLRVLDVLIVFGPGNLMIVFFLLLIHINIVLAIFNFLPIPPLDGSRVLYSIIMNRFPDVVAWLERYGMFVLFGLLFFAGGLIQDIVTFFYNWIFSLFF